METARIMIWGYHAPSNPFSAGTVMNIPRFASDLLNALLLKNVGSVSNYFVSVQDPLVRPSGHLFVRYIRLYLCAIAWED